MRELAASLLFFTEALAQPKGLKLTIAARRRGNWMSAKGLAVRAGVVSEAATRPTHQKECRTMHIHCITLPTAKTQAERGFWPI
jgi:hypothetical protein